MKKWLGHPAPVRRLEATATTVIDAPALSIFGSPALAQGIQGAAMDYILFPGPDERTFASRARFSAHIRHHLIKSPELPSQARLDALWKACEQSHAVVHQAADLQLAERR